MNMKIHQEKQKGCEDPFFYEGLIAENGKYIMIAVGDIEISQNDKDGNYVGLYDGKARDGFDLVFKTDKDLEIVGNDIDNDKYYWLWNNWFEVGHKDDMGILTSNVFHNYSEAIYCLETIKEKI